MIQATFTPGVPSATVHGLHQWDRGRKLQIIAEGLPAAFEVHFECPGMKEAEVRVTELVDGVPTVRIPDRCLKQPAPIKAWVYVTDDTSGRTELAVTLVVTPRLTPPDTSTPEQEDEAADKYDQLFTLMNEAYDAIEACKNIDANADASAASADASAASAGASAEHASIAEGHADEAAKSAEQASTYADAADEAKQQASAFASEAYRAQADVLNSLQKFEQQNLRPNYLRENQNIVYSTTASATDWGLVYCKKKGQLFLVETQDSDHQTTLGVVRWNGQATQYMGGVAIPQAGHNLCFVRLVLRPYAEDTTEYKDIYSGEVFTLGQYRLERTVIYADGTNHDWAPFTDSKLTIKLTPLTETYSN